MRMNDNDGILLVEGPDGWWAWYGVQVTAAADLTEAREYAELDEPSRYAKTFTDDVTYLSRQLAVEPGAAFEARWLSEPTRGELSLALLGRVCAPTSALASHRAKIARHRLAILPRHVHAEPILDTSAVQTVLCPFNPSPMGLAEIRKRCVLGQPNRPDAGVTYYFVILPFRAVPWPWTQLLQSLAEHPNPVMLSVGLEPTKLPAGFADLLQQIATHYGRLACVGEYRASVLYNGPAKLTPEAFAIDAERLYTQAARRYRQTAFRMRIAVGSPALLDDGLLEIIGGTLSPHDIPNQTSNYLTDQLAGAQYDIERPATPTDAATLTRSLRSLGVARWGGAPVWNRSDPPPQTLRLLAETVDPTEAASAFRLPTAAHGSMPGFPVYRPALSLASTYRADGPAISLGQQLVNDRPSDPIMVPLPALTKHTLFLGTTGSGKTNSVLHFLRQLWLDHKIPFLVIEPVNSRLDDYRWLALQPGFDTMLVLTAGDEHVAPLRLNPFEVPEGVRIGSHIASLLACFDAAFGLFDPLPAIYNRALRQTYATRQLATDEIAAPEHAGTWPVLADFVTAIHDVTNNLDYTGEARNLILAASRIRVEQLSEGACSSVLDTHTSYPMPLLLVRPTVVELSSIGDNAKEQSLVIALLLNAMTAHYKANRASATLTHLTVIEEAHRLLGQPARTTGEYKEGNAQTRAAEAFANTLAENRKYGEGLVIVEQDPSKLVTDAYKNTNLKVMHRLPSQADRALIGATMHFSADQERYAATLKPFTGFIHHDGLDRPALVQVPDVRGDAARAAGQPQAPLATDDQLARRFRAVASHHHPVWNALAPYEECIECQHRCLFRSRARMLATPAAADDIEQRINQYLEQSRPQREIWWADLEDAIAKYCGADPAQVRCSTNPNRARQDLHACIFMHLLRRLYGSGINDWIQRFRTCHREKN
jgi:hypothetical protein